MAIVGVDLPAELVVEARAAKLDLAAVVEEALRDVLAARRTDAWLDDVRRLRPVDVPPAVVRAAMQAAKDEFDLG